jgi:hypothetical protein
MKQDKRRLCGFIFDTVSLVTDLFLIFCRFLVYCIGVFDRLNKFNKPKTPYLRTLALTNFLLEFIIQPIRLGGRTRFVLPSFEIQTQLEKKFPSKESGLRQRNLYLYFARDIT